MGRSSNYKKGLEVLPGVIDADYQGEIKIMVKATKHTVIIHQGERIAQILLLPYLKLPNPVLQSVRGSREFGSIDHIHWVKEIKESRPMLTIYLYGKKFVGLLDTGADKTCISGRDWPSHWAVHQTENSLQDLGMASGVAKSSQPLIWEQENKTGNIQPYVITKIMQAVEVAKRSHSLHHQNAATLRYHFQVTREQAREIVKTCPHCPDWGHTLKMGVNPRGLKPRILWQMDITHISEFGKLSYVHVTVDTHSHVVFASARTGEAIKDIIQHLVQSFSYMGVPKKIKTDNAPAYVAKTLEHFYQQWNIAHVTEIP